MVSDPYQQSFAPFKDWKLCYVLPWQQKNMGAAAMKSAEEQKASTLKNRVLQNQFANFAKPSCPLCKLMALSLLKMA